MCVFSDLQCRGWFICILNWTTSVGVGRKTISSLFTVISCIFIKSSTPSTSHITCVTGGDFCPGRSARHSCGTSFWALQHCWCISAVVFSFSCWISGNHAITEAGKDLWDPGVQPLITTLSRDTWVLCKKLLPLLPLKSLKCLCNAALGILWPFIKEVPAALEQNQSLCPRRRKHCSQECLLNLKRVKQLLVSVWISVGGSLCDRVLAPVPIPEGAQVWRAVPAVPLALGESFSFHPWGILECCTHGAGSCCFQDRAHKINSAE